MADDVIKHSGAFRFRRFLNWFPLGLTYAFLYMGRYNLNVAKTALGELMTKEDFGIIFGTGTIVYGFAFLLNGPLTDKIEGKRAMILSAVGTLAANLAMGFYVRSLLGGGHEGADTSNLKLTFALLYAVNMYFQSFGAVAIVKVNARWFHVRERGGFSGIFGTMISSGIFFAYSVNSWILDWAAEGSTSLVASQWVFFAPAALLGVMVVVELILLKDRPSEAGHEDFDTGDGTKDKDAAPESSISLLKRILTHPVILTIAAIEFCTGVLRQGIMQWYPIYAAEVLVLPRSHYMRDGSWGAWWTIVPFFAGAALLFVVGALLKGRKRGLLLSLGGIVFLMPFLQAGWGGLLFVAGVIGGNVAGWLSDSLFGSRRAPTAGFLYILCAVAAIAMMFTMGESTRRVASSKMTGGNGFDALRAGDEIVAIAGRSDIRLWTDVARAVQCVPATCAAPARWDESICKCATSPDHESTATPSDGSIRATVMRGGRRVDLRLEDPSPRQRAGDVRTLKAAPALSIEPYWLGIAVFLISLAVIGTHGLLSGTATMDFGGRRGAATAVGVIDGAVYLGTAVEAVALGYLTSASWSYWPPFLIPFAVVGFLFLLRIWKVVPKGKGGH